MESAKPSDDLRRVVTSLTNAGWNELFVDARSLSEAVLSHWAGAVASFFPGPFTLLTESATAAQVENLLDSGASRIAVQRRALEDPNLIAESTRRFGSGSLAVVVGARRENESWRVYTGKPGVATEWDAITWARVAEAQGAAELIVEALPGASSDEPYDLELLSEVARAVARPVIAFGEPRSVEDCLDALLVGDADAVLLTPALVSGPRSREAIRLFLEEHGVSCP
ncbi:MAG: HisA/HisF-related TIM barrel protein [Gemmatimonadales bacterium]|jgi:cyclase